MTKIIDKILAHRQQQEANRSETSNGAKLYYSLEFFPPKTKAGLDNLLTRIQRMSRCIDPLFVDVTWGASGSTADKTLAVASHVQNHCGVDVLLHLTTTGMSRERLIQTLDHAKKQGIQNILALRGDPPKGQRRWHVGDTSDGFCPRAIDLVRFIREEYGDYFGVAVAGHPEGHPSSNNPKEEMQHLKEKMDAGADVIVTQFFYDVNKFLDFVQRCREHGIICPIIPGIMPIQSYTTLLKMTQYCGVAVPKIILERIERVNKNDDEAVKRIGCEFAAVMCDQIYTKSNGDIDGVHFYTLNLERSVTDIVGMIEVTKLTKAPGELDESFSSTSSRRPDDEVRPINWANRPKSYAKRTEDWDEFPNGRWGDATSPAFGELSDMAHFYGFSLGTESERRTILGNNPTVPQDIYNVFAKYVEGKVPQIPWCENPLQPESLLIQKQLVELNRKGFMTINSQPGVNGKPSDDPIVGWGGTGGYVYQKEYCECFCSPPHAHTLLKTIEKHPSMVMYAVNSKGIQLRSSGEVGAVTALTWGVFPNREIVQPTIFDPDVFLVWAEEAFATWGASWLPLYEKGTQSHALIEEIQNTFYLVAIIENDYISSGSTGDSLMWNTMLGCIDK